MNREELLYLVPYLLSSLGIFLYTWRHRHVRAARPYTWFVSITKSGMGRVRAA